MPKSIEKEALRLRRVAELEALEKEAVDEGNEQVEEGEGGAEDEQVVRAAHKKPRLKRKMKHKTPLPRAGEALDDGKGSSNVVYLGHIPHGFYEKEMRQFFSQFGDVLDLKLFRSKKTGGSKGYAFVKFESCDVARVVADTLNGYYIYEKQLVADVVPIASVHAGMFLPPRVPTTESHSTRSYTPREAFQRAKTSIRKLQVQRKHTEQKLRELGVEVELPPLVIPVRVADMVKRRKLSK